MDLNAVYGATNFHTKGAEQFAAIKAPVAHAKTTSFRNIFSPFEKILGYGNTSWWGKSGENSLTCKEND